MDFLNYHSGTGKNFIGESLDSQTRQVFRSLIAAPKPLLKIRFETTSYAPNHRVTLRNAQDGWTKDIFGIYRFGGWEFFLEKPSYFERLEFKFLLDFAYWMTGSNLNILTSNDANFTESEIQFPPTPDFFKHGYDNFHLDITKASQDSIPNNTREDIEYDVIVIGSGMGGGVLADALSDANIKTLVLEAGGLTLPTHMHNLPGDWNERKLAENHQVGHFNNLNGSKFIPGVHLSLGGRSNYWSGLIPRMQSWELEFWPDEIRDFLTSQQGYDEAEKTMRKGRTLGPFQDNLVDKLSTDFGDWNVGNLPISRHQPNISNVNTVENVLESSSGTFSTTDLLMTSMSFNGTSGRDNLTINLGHLVTKLETDGSRVIGVICEDLLGNVTRRYKGKIIVLAAGSLESPKIVLNSNLNNPNNLVGVGLTDHPAFFSRKYTIPDGNPFGGIDKHAKLLMFKRDARIDNHPFNIEILINPVYWNLRKPDDDIQQQPNPSTIQMTFPFSSFLNNDNFIRSNGIGKKLSVKVKENDSGVAHFNDAQAIRNRILSELEITFDPNEGMGYGNEGTVHHAGGTLRMSTNGTGVVDISLKFESYDNLYCADPSVWPFIPAANPSLTLVALSLRLAREIKSKL